MRSQSRDVSLEAISSQDATTAIEGLAGELRASVEHLASTIGERNCYRPESLEAAACWIERQFGSMGLNTRRLPVKVPARRNFACGPTTVWNIEAKKPGMALAHEVLIVGAHYDSKVAMPTWYANGPPLPDQPGTPGANDNASGMAAVLAMARVLSNLPTERTIRFLAFVNEEPPFFQTEAMGSRVYARSLGSDRSLKVVGAIIPETIGCYSKQVSRKRIPMGSLVGLPDRPDYVAFLANRASRVFARRCAMIFGERSRIEVRTVAIPAFVKPIAWSDDWSFWQEGIPAFAVTDTAFMRSDHYHEVTDTADRLDYLPIAEVVEGLIHLVRRLSDQ